MFLIFATGTSYLNKCGGDKKASLGSVMWNIQWSQ